MSLTLPMISREEAAERGYVAITTVFTPKEEPEIALSMERSMRGIDAVWITAKHGYRTVAELGRRSREVNLIISDNHPRNNWTQPAARTPHRNSPTPTPETTCN